MNALVFHGPVSKVVVIDSTNRLLKSLARKKAVRASLSPCSYLAIRTFPTDCFPICLSCSVLLGQIVFDWCDGMSR